jgi:energy-coupling factor transport system permease protein
MISSLTYLPRPTALGRAGAGAASLYLFALATIAFLTSSPIVLAGLGSAIALAGIRAGAGRALLLSLRWGATLAVLVIIVNAVASQRGDTILLRGPHVPVLGQIDVSLEALVEGAILASRVALVIAVFCVHSAVIDPDRLLRLLRPIARRSALTAALITRLVPLAARDHERLAEGAALRGPGAAALTRSTLVRRLVAGSLDRAVDVAATLELRGYAGEAPGRVSRGRRSPRDPAFVAAALASLVLVVAARLAGLADFDAYPTVTMSSGLASWAVALSLPLLAAAPFSFDRARRAQRRRAQRAREMRAVRRGGAHA